MNHDIAIMHVMYTWKAMRASENYHRFCNLLRSRLRLRLDDPLDDLCFLDQECSEDAIIKNTVVSVYESEKKGKKARTGT